MSEIAGWIGKTQTRETFIDLATADKISATLDGFIKDWKTPILEPNSPLPALWHWAWFNDVSPAQELGRDGHPAKGGFLPPVKLPRRMWAGGRLEFINALPIGAIATRKSEILDIKEKSGKTGPLCFVTVRHTISAQNQICIIEEHDIVYRGDSVAQNSALTNSNANIAPDVTAPSDCTFTPNTTLLFRYSALTFNGHRIHYDHQYAREVEGYRNLIFHGPLCAMFMLQFAQTRTGKKPIANFSFRALKPLFVDEPITLQLKEAELGQEISAINATNETAMKATVILAE